MFGDEQNISTEISWKANMTHVFSSVKNLTRFCPVNFKHTLIQEIMDSTACQEHHMCTR